MTGSQIFLQMSGKYPENTRKMSGLCPENAHLLSGFMCYNSSVEVLEAT